MVSVQYEFLQINRIKQQHAIIMFYCLDPHFPGLPELVQYDVDGVVTNSAGLVPFFKSHGFESTYIMLAADSDAMQPNTSIARSIATIYVGAGGGMLDQKPELAAMLSVAMPFGLHIYGNGWGFTDQWRGVWKGVLPHGELANAYASARIVLASTIQSQEHMSMINNRIFEALACGSIVLTQYSSTLYRTFGDLIYYYHDTTQIPSIIDTIISDPIGADSHRAAVRNHVQRYHSYDHRVIEFLSFYGHIRTLRSRHATSIPISYSAFNQLASNAVAFGKSHQPIWLWVVADRLSSHFDVRHVINLTIQRIISQYATVVTISEAEYSQHVLSCLSCAHTSCQQCQWLATFDVLFSVLTPLDTLDRLNLQLPMMLTKRACLQKRAAYLLGFDRSLVLDSDRPHAANGKRIVAEYKHYDVIFFRDSYDIELLEREGYQIAELRRQHAFAVTLQKVQKSLADSDTSSAFKTLPIVVCCYADRELCTLEMRMRELMYSGSNANINANATSIAHRLVLIGGDFSQWNTTILQLQDTYWIPDAHLGIDQFTFLLHPQGLVLFMNSAGNDSNSVNDITSLLLAAILADAKIHIAHYNAHYLHITKSNPRTWDEGDNYLSDAVQFGLERLYGLASASSKIDAYIVYPTDTTIASSSKVELDGEIAQPKADARLASGVQESDLPYLLTYFNVTTDRSFALISLHLTHFKIGRDGLCCIMHSQDNSTITCMLRSFDYVLLSLPASMQGGHLNVSLTLRGSTYKNAVYVTEFPVPLAHRGKVLDSDEKAQNRVAEQLLATIYPYRPG